MIEYLEWDSDFFCISVGSVRNRITSKSDLDSMLCDMRESNLNLVYVTLPMDRPDLITRILRERGAILADTRAEMAIDLKRYHSSKAVTQSTDYILRTAENEDAASIGELASYCFRGLTRFYRDPRLNDERCDELYRTWAERDIRKRENLSLLCTTDGRLAGFCTAEITGNEDARIGLIGITPDFRGFGIGQVLLKKTAGMLGDKGCGQLVAVTQLASIGAMRMYERAGFLLREISIVVHLWQDVEGI
ncbi:MAG: GNAT family N-acetyltransferase [Candidatus Aegiribacteria sp.]|nr:GNAT family N-acetyltransferase [Candidatus Aegiribacteria sp.]